MLYQYMKELVTYAIDKELILECERIYSINLLLDLFKESSYSDRKIKANRPLEMILAALLDEGCKRGIIENTITDRDLFDTKIMNCVVPRPSQVIEAFNAKYKVSSERATNYYYKLSKDSDYIREYRVKKDWKWKVDTEYGEMDITINLSKPEKDPKAIAAAKLVVDNQYPKCLLCIENEGYAGRLDHPARETLRVIPITINQRQWGLQYSPYSYYNEHCIVLSGAHVPMQVNRESFIKLFDFVVQFPHYFLGSNADLPIVGGSILSHDHFQGGRYTFAMEEAKLVKTFAIPEYKSVEVGIVKWPMSVLRLRSKDTKVLIDLGTHILEKWRSYTDESANIYAHTGSEPHNTITPIVRKRANTYELDLVLRNNKTTDAYPFGLYHPHEQYHHIKKENIGLIEVMGLAVLPARLKDEMELLGEYIVEEKNISSNASIEKHENWAINIRKKHNMITKDNIMSILQEEIGQTFTQVLKNAGVYKDNERGRNSFTKFINTL